MENLFPQDTQFINCLYTFSRWIYDNEGMRDHKEHDSVILVWKDKTGKKGYTFIESPEYTFYVTKDIEKQFSKIENGFEYRYISLDDVVPVTTKYEKRYLAMRDATTRQEVKDFYKACKDEQNYKKLQEMHYFNEFHNSDVNITDYYVDKFCVQNDQSKCDYGLSIASCDIEVDGADYPGFPDENIAPCPVNLITYYNDQTNVLTVYMLEYDTDTFRDCVTKTIKQKVKEVKEKYYKYFDGFTVKCKKFKNELALIKNYFDDINTDRPDYVTFWNARFDILTLWNRLKQLLAGSDLTPEDIMCPEDFPLKRVIIRIDDSQESQNDFTARTDVFNIYGYSVWIDMLPLYGNITRPKGKKDSYTLNAIGLEETGMSKEDLSAEDTDIKTAHLDNYSLFFKYGCIDTMLLALIVKNTGFINLLQTIVTLTHTRANKALTKTVCLRNFVNYFYNLMGYTISNNRCYIHNFDKTGISGAYVADPNLLDLIGRINGIPSNKILDLVIDEDLSSMYPSILRALNISSSTAKYRIIVNKGAEDITKPFMEAYLSDDSVSYCTKYHNLPDYDEIYNLFA